MITGFDKKENRKFFNKQLLFKTLGVVLLVIIFLFIIADFRIYQKKKELNVQINNYQKKIEDIKKSSQNLKDKIANSDNVDYLEKLAYEQLGQQRPGEKQIIFITPEENQKTTTVEPKNFLDVRSWTGWFSGAWRWIIAQTRNK